MKKLDEIDILLENDEELSKYINKMENTDLEIPKNLDNKIMGKIQRNKRKYYMDICKIAACLIFGLFLCNTSFIKNDSFNFEKYEIKKEKSIAQEKISELCYFLTTPINIERDGK